MGASGGFFMGNILHVCCHGIKVGKVLISHLGRMKGLLTGMSGASAVQ